MSSAIALGPENRAMSSVFVSNVPYDVTEDLLKAVFSEISPILNFRVFPDKSANKSKVAFCEYKDPEMAMRAIRRFNGYECKGQTIYVDLATSEKCRQELERLQASIENSADASDSAADKAPEEISKAVASLPAEQMFELMKQMKMCIENNPQEARNLLLQNPQLAYALLQAQVIMRIVDPIVAVKILNRPSVPPADLNAEVKSEPAPVAPPMSEDSTPFPSGVSAATTDPVTVNIPAAVPHPAPVPVPSAVPVAMPGLVLPVRPSGLPVMSGPPNAPGIPNQFADQDLRSMGDQDLRTLPNLGDRDMRAPPGMMGVDKDMRQPMGDHDFRTLGVPPTTIPESRPYDPRFRGMQTADRNIVQGFERPRPANLDPRTAYDPRNPGAPPRVEDPRKASLAAASLNSRLSAAGPALQNLGPHPPGGPAGMMSDEQEKTALIMQVLQLTDQQIAALPPEQRQSIMVLKEQLARTQMA